VTNRLDMGHLISAEGFVTTHYRPEMWQMFENRYRNVVVASTVTMSVH